MIVSLIFLLLLFVGTSQGASKDQRVLIFRPLLNCVVCNSLLNSNCAKSGDHLKDFIQRCPNKNIKNKIIKPVGCRVSYQTVPGLLHYPEKIKIVSRECAYNEKFENAKFEGSSHSIPAIKYEAYQCFDNRKGKLPCNLGAAGFLPPILSLFIFSQMF